MIKVFGHKPPDTDATCSPIVYAWYLSEKKSTPAKAFRLGELNRETKFVLEKFSIKTPDVISKVGEDDKVIIIDTTNPDELPEGITEAEVVEIIDHHKMGGLTTQAPLKATIRPIACSATILWQIMKEDGNEDITKEMAGLLVSAILSDTLKFTSPTTTDEDKKAAEELVKIADIDIDSHSKEMFGAKSDLSGMTPEEILLVDAKTFEFGSKKTIVGVLETTKPENALSQKDDLLKEMKAIKEKKQLDEMFFFVIDIIESEATALVIDSAKDAVKKAFDIKVEDNQVHLPGVVSRKKQIVPNLEKALS